MSISNELISDFKEALIYGEQVRFKYFSQSFVGEYDDDISLTQSGNDYWCSGLVLPIDTRTGGHDALLLQQGKILLDDKKIYVNGDVQTSGLSPIKIGMNGSPTSQQYEIVEGGRNIEWNINGTPIYKKIYIRFLPNGSFVGE